MLTNCSEFLLIKQLIDELMKGQEANCRRKFLQKSSVSVKKCKQIYYKQSESLRVCFHFQIRSGPTSCPMICRNCTFIKMITSLKVFIHYHYYTHTNIIISTLLFSRGKVFFLVSLSQMFSMFTVEGFNSIDQRWKVIRLKL